MSMLPGGLVPGAAQKLTSAVTLYVPLPVSIRVPVVSGGLKVCQAPPPVTSSESPGTNIPEPVSVISELSFVSADAVPPGKTLRGVAGGGGWRLMISHRTTVSSAYAMTVLNEKLSSTTAIPRSKCVTVLIALFILPCPY